MPEPAPSDAMSPERLAAAFAAPGAGPAPDPKLGAFVYVVTLRSAMERLTRASRFPPSAVIDGIEEARSAWPPRFFRWIDGDGDDPAEIVSVMYVPPVPGS